MPSHCRCCSGHFIEDDVLGDCPGCPECAAKEEQIARLENEICTARDHIVDADPEESLSVSLIRMRDVYQQQIAGLQACVRQAGLGCFLSSGTPEQIAKHMDGIAKSWIEGKEKDDAQIADLQAKLEAAEVERDTNSRAWLNAASERDALRSDLAATRAVMRRVVEALQLAKDEIASPTFGPNGYANACDVMRSIKDALAAALEDRP